MVSGLDALRKGYAQLTPFERANMILIEATTNQREAVVDALQPPTLWDAYHEASASGALILLAGVALAQSLKAKRASLANMVLAMRCLAREKISEERERYYETRLDNVVQLDGISRAWITALAKMDQETGGAFLAASKLLDSTYADEILAQVGKQKREPADDTHQLEQLRTAWQCVNGEAHHGG